MQLLIALKCSLCTSQDTSVQLFVFGEQAVPNRGGLTNTVSHCHSRPQKKWLSGSRQIGNAFSPVYKHGKFYWKLFSLHRENLYLLLFQM